MCFTGNYKIYLFSEKDSSFLVATIFSFISVICNIISFVSPYWIVSIENTNNGFQRLGLWEVCFENFVFPEDYVSKAYQGCWYIYYPEYKYIMFWLNPPWLFVVQISSIISIICNLAGIIVITLTLCEYYTIKEKKPHYIIFGLQMIAFGVCIYSPKSFPYLVWCLVIDTIFVGVMSKDRAWLPRSDLNKLSWSFAFAVLAGFFLLFSLLGLFTHLLSIKSNDLISKYMKSSQNVIFSESLINRARSSSYYDAAAESKLGAGTIPSLFTMAQSTHTGYHTKTMSSLYGHSTQRQNVAPGAIDSSATATSAAVVSAKLRETLEAQRAAVIEAQSHAEEILTYEPHARNNSIAMDSAV